MIDINKLLYKANVYSIEFSGFISLKLSLSDESTLYKACNDVTLEFNSGAVLTDTNGDQVDLFQNVFKLFGSFIKYSSLLNDDIVLEFDDKFRIESENTYDENELIDIYWVLKETVSGNYLVFNDTNEIIFSNGIKELF